MAPPRQSLEWAASEARRIIHDNDVERLKRLLTKYPALLSWQGETAQGWAYYAAKNEKMADWLEEAERRRKSPAGDIDKAEA